MNQTWKKALLGLVATAALAAAPQASHALGCGDLNNDNTKTTADAILLSQCIANGGTCPAVSPGPLCGTGNLIDCGDVFGDGNVGFAALTADLAALLANLSGLATLYDICEGPAPAIACPGGTVTLPSQTISSSQTWPASCTVKLGGTVFIDTPMAGPTTVLRIEPGSVVKGVPGTVDPSALIVLSGARVDFQGTQSQPIVFTTDQAPGSRTQGAWGGVMINGRSTVNGANCQFLTEGIPVPFGGCVTDDSSGIASFVRVEFGGRLFTANNELNAFTMNGIGSQTQFNFIHAHLGLDDALEWFGGTSNHTNMIASAFADDGFDFQLGFTGSVQYGLAFQNGATTDPGADSRGIEGDNSEFDNNATPRSDPDFCNVTFVGGQNQGPEFPSNGGSDAGILLRRGTRAQIANVIVTNFGDAGIELRDNSTTAQGCVDANTDGIPESLTGDLIVRNSVFFNNGSAGAEQAKDGSPLDATAGADLNACVGAPSCACDTETWYNLLVTGFNVLPANGGVGPDPGIDDTYPALDNGACTGLETPFVCCSGAGTGSCRALPDARSAIANPPPFACSNINPLFDNVTYLGGLNPGAPCTTTGAGAACDWLSKPWVEFAVN